MYGSLEYFIRLPIIYFISPPLIFRMYSDYHTISTPSYDGAGHALPGLRLGQGRAFTHQHFHAIAAGRIPSLIFHFSPYSLQCPNEEMMKRAWVTPALTFLLRACIIEAGFMPRYVYLICHKKAQICLAAHAASRYCCRRQQHNIDS